MQDHDDIPKRDCFFDELNRDRRTESACNSHTPLCAAAAAVVVVATVSSVTPIERRSRRSSSSIITQATRIAA
jgi:hypothetical protein